MLTMLEEETLSEGGNMNLHAQLERVDETYRAYNS